MQHLCMHSWKTPAVLFYFLPHGPLLLHHSGNDLNCWSAFNDHIVAPQACSPLPVSSLTLISCLQLQKKSFIESRLLFSQQIPLLALWQLWKQIWSAAKTWKPNTMGILPNLASSLHCLLQFQKNSIFSIILVTCFAV